MTPEPSEFWARWRGRPPNSSSPKNRRKNGSAPKGARPLRLNDTLGVDVDHAGRGVAHDRRKRHGNLLTRFRHLLGCGLTRHQRLRQKDQERYREKANPVLRMAHISVGMVWV
jgi:hypothetical protein